MEKICLAPCKKNATRLAAHLVFIDESGFLLIPSVLKTWSPVGQTPILHHRYRHDRISAISGIAVFGLNKLIASSVNGRENLKLFSSFALDNGQVAVVALILLLVGAALGSLGAGIAVTRYLDA